jgi:hypothetical protein
VRGMCAGHVCEEGVCCRYAGHVFAAGVQGRCVLQVCIAGILWGCAPTLFNTVCCEATEVSEMRRDAQ